LNGEGAAVPRYALYYAPRPSDGLAVTASQWLGRDPETGQTRALRPVPGIAMDRLVEITAEPRLYGFHGTLKAPIALADGASERDFLDAVGRFAANDRTFAIPALELAEISGFLALVPAARCTELHDLADRCVVEFDEFRQPAGEAELARRRAAGLTPRQDELLVRWGYPYVLEQWRFHLTLTGRLPDAPNARRWPRCCASALAPSPTVRCRSTTSASSVSPLRGDPSSCWRASSSAADGG
jgi:hypothetical protein